MRPHIALVYYSLRLLGLMPLRCLHGMGAGIGSLLARGKGRLAWHAKVNMRLVRPDWNQTEQQQAQREIMRHTGRALLEMAAIWGRRPPQALQLVRQVHGETLFREALADERGLIIAAPHAGCWELLNYWLCAQTKMAILYAPPRRANFEALLQRARGAAGPEQIRAGGSGIRELYRRLKQGETVGILPDQEPRRGDGRFAPFFGIETLSMVLLPRLASRTGAIVLFAFAERLPQGKGFDIHFLPCPAGIDDADLTRACAAMNAGVEACAETAFFQYQWTYKRFRERPDGSRSFYRR